MQENKEGDITEKKGRRGEGGGVGEIGIGRAIRNLVLTGGNTQREWGDIHHTKNGIHLRLPLSNSGRGRDEIEILNTK